MMAGEWWIPQSLIDSITNAPPIPTDEQGRPKTLLGRPIVYEHETPKVQAESTEDQMTTESEKRPAIAIERGNTEGQHFTQLRIDDLEELLSIIVFAFGDQALVEVQNAKVWYDAEQDYHRLEFTASGKLFHVQYYKVYSLLIDGKNDWTGVVRSDVSKLASHIRKQIKAGATT